MRRRVGIRQLACLAGALVLAGGLAVVGSAAPATAEPITQDFGFTNGAQSYTVPPGVCQVTIDAFGAQGGAGRLPADKNSGGLGGRATATIPVTPGEVLQVNVGGQGAQGTIGTGGAGGFNGGGAGGAAGSSGGGGGGASDVRQGGTGLANRVVIAGGGGGGASAGPSFPGQGIGGGGGGANGDPGTGGGPSVGAGGGGTQSGGGTSGVSNPAGVNGEPGQSGIGGAGAASTLTTGGGGGGGYFGGGGGGADDTSNIAGGGGGGGSGFGPAGTVFENGVRSSQGEILITADPEVTCESAAVAVLIDPNFTG